jgi:hypothetical protein
VCACKSMKEDERKRANVQCMRAVKIEALNSRGKKT